MEDTDWRCVSQHYITELVEKAVSGYDLPAKFKPSLIIAAGEDALSVSRILRSILKAKDGSAVPILTPKLDLYDEETNPYTPNQGYWGNHSFSGHHILVVDKADNSRTSLAHFLAEIQKHFDAQKAAATDGAWEDPQVGVFVLHNKRRPKAADLPPEVSNGRYFACEECDNVAISYPFAIKETELPAHQPTAHGDHPHLGGSKRRASFEDAQNRNLRVATPPPTRVTRMLSSHYVEEVIEKALEEQQVFEKFRPTVLVAVCDDSLAPARILRHHFRSRRGGESLPVLTSKLDLYDEEANPYNPVLESWASKSFSGQRLLLVEKVVKTRATLVQYLEGVQKRIENQRSEATSSGSAWEEPVIGVFVLHDKDGIKAAPLPPDILQEHYFVAEHMDDVQIAYPFHVDGPLPS